MKFFSEKEISTLAQGFKDKDEVLSWINEDVEFLENWKKKNKFISLEDLKIVLTIALDFKLISLLQSIEEAWKADKIENELKKWNNQNKESKKTVFFDLIFLAMPILGPVTLSAIATKIGRSLAQKFPVDKERQDIIKASVKTAVKDGVKTIRASVENILNTPKNEPYFEKQLGIIDLVKALKSQVLTTNLNKVYDIHILYTDPEKDEKFKLISFYFIFNLMKPFKKNVNVNNITYDPLYYHNFNLMKNLIARYKNIVLEIGSRSRNWSTWWRKHNNFYSYVVGKIDKQYYLFEIQLNWTYTHNMMMHRLPQPTTAHRFLIVHDDIAISALRNGKVNWIHCIAKITPDIKEYALQAHRNRFTVSRSYLISPDKDYKSSVNKYKIKHFDE